LDEIGGAGKGVVGVVAVVIVGGGGGANVIGRTVNINSLLSIKMSQNQLALLF
jgi:hypothetical protein